MVSEVIADSGFQLANRFKGAAADAFVGEQTKEALHLVQPTGTGGSEVHMVARPAGDQRFTFGILWVP